MNRGRYIGINSLPVKDVPEVIDGLSTPPGGANIGIAFGVPASEKTQLLREPNRYGPDWYPVGGHLSRWVNDLWRATKLDGIIHFNSNNLEPFALLAFTNYVLATTARINVDDSGADTRFMIGSNARGVQLNNLPWINTDYRTTLDNLRVPGGASLGRVVLQANYELLAASPEQLAVAALRYSDVISHVLLDPSGGTGKRLDPKALRPFIEALLAEGISVGIAGGLEADTVEDLAGELLRQYPISVDAETGLRRNYDSDNPSKSEFDPDKARAFIDKVYELTS